MLPFVWVLLGLADLGVPHAWADDTAPASTSGAIEVKDLPPYPSYQILSLGTSLDGLKEKTFSELTVTLSSGLGMERLDRGSIPTVKGAMVSFDQGKYTFKQSGAEPLAGSEVVAQVLSVRALLAPGATSRALRVEGKEVTGSGKDAVVSTFSLNVSISASFRGPLAAELRDVPFRAESPAPSNAAGLAAEGGGKELPTPPPPPVVPIGADLIGTMKLDGEPAGVVTQIELVGLRFGEEDRIAAPSKCSVETTAPMVRCAFGETSTDVGKPTGLGQALQALAGLSLQLPSSYNARELLLRATFDDGGRTHTAEIARVEVLPAMPLPPAGCVGVELLRYGPGKDWWQGTLAARPDAVAVFRSQAVLESAMVVAPWAPRAKGLNPVGDSTQCDDFVDEHKDDGLGIRLALTSVPEAGSIEVCVENSDGGGAGGCKTGNAALSAVVGIRSGDGARIAKFTGNGFVIPNYPHQSLVSAWNLVSSTTDDARVSASSTAPPDGEIKLYATVELVSTDGRNTATMISDMPVIALVDEDPLWSFEVVTHPGSTAFTFLKCRDVGVAGDLANADLEVDACLDRPGGTLVSGSLQMVPAGLKLRYTPFYHMPWVGFSGEVNATGIGVSKVFSEVTGDDVKAGLASYANAIVGLELNTVDRASDASPTNAPVGFTLGGGVSLIQGAEGPVARGVMGLSISVRAFDFTRRQDSAKTAETGDTPEPPTDGS